MARIQYSSLANTAAGILSGSIISNWKGRSYLKSHNPHPRQPSSQTQQQLRGIVNDLSGQWYSLTATQKQLWESYASILPKPQSGLNAFVSLNVPLLHYLGSAYKILSPPPTPATPEHPQTIAVSPKVGSRFNLSWTKPDNTDTYVLSHYWAMPGRQDAQIHRWISAPTTPSNLLLLHFQTDHPAGTVLSFQLRSLDLAGRLSPLSHTISATTLPWDQYLFVADTQNNRIHKRLASDFSFVAKIGSQGSGDDQFHFPWAVPADDTHFFVGEEFNHRIQKRLKSDLSFVAKIGSQGSGDDQFNRPIGLSPDDTHLFVADSFNHRIQKRLKSDLSFVAKIGSLGSGNDQFNYPFDIAADDTYIYIVEYFNHRLQKRLKSNLSFVAKIGSVGSGNNQFRTPSGVAVDDTYVYVADYGNNRIQKRLKSDLSFVAKIGSFGSGDDQFNQPRGLYPDDTHLYVADSFNHRIQKRLKSDLSFVAKIGSLGSGNDQFNVPAKIAFNNQFT